MRTQWVRWVAVVSLLVFFATQGGAAAFQSDELSEDDDEWGLVGGISAPPTPPKVAELTTKPASSAMKSSSGGSRVNTPSTDRKVQFTLDHSFGGSEFSLAGVFTARLRDSVKGGQTLSKFRLSRDAFSEEDKKKFQELLDKDDFYSIRVPSNVLNPGKSYAVSSVKARCLAESNFQERFDFQMDQGNVIGVTYGGWSSCSYPRASRTPSQWTFDPLIIFKTAEQASRSLFAPEIVNVAAEDDIVADDGTVVTKLPEKSFWAKYWMYVVPIALILVNAVTQFANLPEEGAPAQGAAGTQARVGGPGGGGARRR
ncbi:unnamed protein product [Calypogeia fissa]